MRWPWSRKQRVEFDSPPISIVEMFAQMADATGTSVSRSKALSVPAVRRGRNLICSVATMPLEQHGPDNTVVESPLLRQIDPDVANVVMLAQTVEDLLFDGVSWWLVTLTDFAGYPMSARHLDVGAVSLQPPGKSGTPAPLPSGIDPRGGVVWVDGKPVGGDRIIRFDSPNPAVLDHAGREIRRAVALDRAAVMYADDPRPADFFEPAENADEVDDAEVEVILAKWKAARKRRATAYVPASLKYHSVDSPAPRDLQLVELQRQVNLDIANALGIDPEDLGISTTSRTYANDVDRRRNKLNEVLSPYMKGITDRLSMGDVTKRGYTVLFNTTEYLQPNPTDRWAVYTSAKALDAITVPEIRQAERWPPLPEADAEAGAAGSTGASTRELQLVEQIQKIYLGVGTVITAAEAREILNRSGAGLVVDAPVATDPQPAPPSVTPEPEPGAEPEQEDPTVTASRPLAVTFDDSRGLTFVDLPVSTFSVNREGRTIEGVALPYGQLATKGGLAFRFDRGALTWDAENPGRVKLLRDHDPRQAIGRAIQLRDTAAGVLARFKVARGAAGDEALELAEDGVLDGFSVGVDFDASADTIPDPQNKGALLVRRADLRETSLTAMPSFDNARVTKVAASRTAREGSVPDDQAPTTEPAAAPDATTGQESTELALSDDLRTELAKAMLAKPGALQAAFGQPAATPTPAAPAVPKDLIDALVSTGAVFSLLGIPDPGKPAAEPERPEVVNPTRSPVLFVREALPYQFDRGGSFVRSEHDFSADLHEMALAKDHGGNETDAGKRVMGFLQVAFAETDTADVNELNPTINRPDLYVDQRDFRYPIWNAINRGAPPNGVQPFMFPKFSSASGLVGDHTEGTEPTGGTFVTTSQTITPTAISGKASITREVWDMGGNPAVSTLIFNQMVRGWNEGLESAAATFLATLTAATDITLGVATVDDVLVDAWDAAVAGLQFVRGYDFEVFAVEQVLYLAFVAASDGDGRKLVPQINPQNANSTAARRFSQLDLAGVMGTPSWALASTPGALNSSWLFDPSVVWGFASAPQRLEFPGSGGAAAGVEYKPVAHVDLAIWGYKAFANTDIGGVRQVTYDSVT
jgi:HK97 family phage prohead protease